MSGLVISCRGELPVEIIRLRTYACLIGLRRFYVASNLDDKTYKVRIGRAILSCQTNLRASIRPKSRCVLGPFSFLAKGVPVAWALEQRIDEVELVRIY